MKRVSKKVRNWLMGQPEFCPLNMEMGVYRGKTYHYQAITRKEIKGVAKNMLNWLSYWNKPWIWRLFHKEPNI